MPATPRQPYPFASLAVGQSVDWLPSIPVRPPAVRAAAARFRAEVLVEFGIHVDLEVSAIKGGYRITRHPDRAAPRGPGRRPASPAALPVAYLREYVEHPPVLLLDLKPLCEH